MFKNYLTIAIRQIFKNKVFSFINIAGLAIGMAAVILLSLWIENEVSYDRFHTKKDRIYNLWNRAMWGDKLECWDVTPRIAASTIKENFPEVEKIARVDWNQSRWLRVNNQIFLGSGNAVDPSFLEIFDFPLIKGDKNSIFKEPNSIVITPELSTRLFGNEEAIGKTIEFEDKQVVTVTGIIATPPNNTRFKFEYLLPWAFLNDDNTGNYSWGNNSTRTYLLLKENVAFEPLQQKIKTIRKDYAKVDDVYDMFLYPIERWRLYSSFENGIESGGKIEMVRWFSIIAGFILLIACINFMNLSTAKSEKRAKEVGIRKTVGAERFSLVKQFLGETIILSFISFIIAIIIVQLSLPAFNELIQKKLLVNYYSLSFWSYSILFILFSGFLAGMYPAFYISAFNPVKVLKGTFRQARAALTPRKVLVVTQFVFAIALIIATIIIKQQISFVLQRDVGYEKDLLAYHFINERIQKNFSVIKAELLSKNIATSVTRSSSPITQGWSDSWGFTWEGKDPNDRTDFDRFYVDEDFVKTAGVKMLQGRDFNLQKFATDSFAMIVNESALKAMKFKNPIGQIVKDGETPYHVVGVMSDFILHSPFYPTKPMLVMGASGYFNVLNIKLKNNSPELLSQAETIFKKYDPEYPFDLKFVDHDHASKFEDVERIGSLATLFSGLTIIISCLGLFGLSSFMAENRIKEIGIRKVLGASVAHITFMLSGGFIKLILVAIGIATPIAWWLMSKWIEDYPYRTPIHWWIFVLAGVIAIAITLITVGYQSIKAALDNPVKSLRTE